MIKFSFSGFNPYILLMDFVYFITGRAKQRRLDKKNEKTN